MNIIFLGESPEYGFSVYLDQKTAKEKGWTSALLEGLYIFYYEGLVKYVRPPLDNPLPCIFL